MLKGHDEKRNFYRMNTNTPLTFKIIGEDQNHVAQCINLSGSGLLLHTEDHINNTTQLEINITPEKTVTPPLHAIIEVVRVEENSQNQSYYVAGVIKEIMQ
jgi:hypothetical protein